MDDLTAFISARLDEDEAVAKAAAGPDWHEDSTALTVFTRQQADGDRPGVRGIAWCSNGYGDDRANVRHIARHDPARVLREVAVLRGIVTIHNYEGSRCDSCEYDCPVTALAAIWSDHPDYQQEWTM